jgi:hypothetical protein
MVVSELERILKEAAVPYFFLYPGIRLRGLSKTTDNLS